MHNLDLFGEPDDSTVPQPSAASVPTTHTPQADDEASAALPPDMAPPPPEPMAHPQLPHEDTAPSATDERSHLAADDGQQPYDIEENDFDFDVRENGNEPADPSHEVAGGTDISAKKSKTRHSARVEDMAPLTPTDVTLELIHPREIKELKRKDPRPESTFGLGLKAGQLRPALDSLLSLTRLMLVVRQEKRSRTTYVALCNQDLLQYYRERALPIIVGVITDPSLISLLHRDDLQVLMEVHSCRPHADERPAYIQKLKDRASWKGLFESDSASADALAGLLGVSVRTLSNKPKNGKKRPKAGDVPE